jgi:uncharacterized membrane protein SpoIIM required for sporulation
MPAIQLKSYEFRREREGAWRRLETLVDRVEKKGIASLSGEELTQLPRLYRNALSSLSVARAISLDKNLLEYLEALSQRAYFAVYGVRRHLRETLADFFTRAFPAAVRRFRWHLLVAGATLLVGVLAGYVLTRADPDRFYAFVSPEMANGRDPDASTQSLRDTLYSDHHQAEGLGVFASFLFTHNARVGMLCFALGFLAGVPVFLLLLTNGLLLGAFWALFSTRGLGTEFWAWISPHGVTEILAVVLCGAGGLVLAQSLVFPGRLARLQNLARRGREAGVVLLGAVVMLLIAGLIEGVFRQVVHDVAVRYSVTLLTTAVWIWYFGTVGRGRHA